MVSHASCLPHVFFLLSACSRCCLMLPPWLALRFQLWQLEQIETKRYFFFNKCYFFSFQLKSFFKLFFYFWFFFFQHFQQFFKNIFIQNFSFLFSFLLLKKITPLIFSSKRQHCLIFENIFFFIKSFTPSFSFYTDVSFLSVLQKNYLVFPSFSKCVTDLHKSSLPFFCLVFTKYILFCLFTLEP